MVIFMLRCELMQPLAWMGEYPSMWLAPDELLGHLRDHMAG